MIGTLRRELLDRVLVVHVRELDQTGTPVTFETVAREAEVSRSWLYTQPDLKDEIHRLRALGNHTPSKPTPSRQRTTESSLLQRLEIANNRNRELTEENQRLRRQLERTLGQLRTASPPTTVESTPEPSSTRRASITIGPC